MKWHPIRKVQIRHYRIPTANICASASGSQQKYRTLCSCKFVPNIFLRHLTKTSNVYGKSKRRAIAKLLAWSSINFRDLYSIANWRHREQQRSMSPRSSELSNICAPQRKTSSVVRNLLPLEWLGSVIARMAGSSRDHS